MDDRLIRQRIRGALDPGDGFPDPSLLDRAMIRVQEADGRHLRLGPRLAAVAVALLALASVGMLVMSRIGPTSVTPAHPGTSGTAPIISVTSTRSGGVEDLRFVSATAGWLVEHAGGGHTHVLRTLDGGAHWTQVGDLAGLQPYVTTGDFVGDGEAAIVGPPQKGTDLTTVAGPGGRVYSTTDGGSHWQEADIPVALGFLRSSSFVSPQEGWIATGPPNGGSVSVYHTTDAGRHWRLLASTATTAALSGLGPKGPRIEFTSPEVGWISTFTQSGAALLLGTRDGGRAWRPVDLPAPPGVNMAGLRVTSDFPTLFGTQGLLVAWIEAEGTAVTGRLVGGAYLYSTQDGGLHWTYVRAVAGPWPTFLDATHWANFGPDPLANSVSFTADAGQTWTTPRRIPAPAGWAPFYPTFVGSSGWAVVTPDSKGPIGGPNSAGQLPPYGVILTTDGGAHWVDSQLPHSS
jgi:photosystem II stability/assembly factor-like uncharacterized protein